jgi:formylglycine-generating enzyme required for sulfatase activity
VGNAIQLGKTQMQILRQGLMTSRSARPLVPVPATHPATGNASVSDPDLVVVHAMKDIDLNRMVLDNDKAAVASGNCSALPQPNYPDEFSRTIGEQIDERKERWAVLRAAGASQEQIQAVQAEIRELKRQLRQGPQLQPGEWLANRYKLYKYLDAGGFGAVWQAYDSEQTQIVAVKVLHAHHGGNRERREQFERGARAMQRLNHPNMVRILAEPNLDRESGHRYFVMEYVGGGTFADAVRGGALPVENRIEVVLAVGDALVHAHEHDILHRDVTPNNILLGGTDGRVLLSDFDLARLPDSTAGTGPVGKFAYAAPECMESAREADPRSDVYSLGMTAVFAYHGKDLPGPAYLYANRARFFKDLACPPKVKEILVRATDLDRDQRFDTMKEFCARLREAVARSKEVTSLPREFVNSIGMSFVLVEPGTFLMGSPGDEDRRDDDEQQHEVTITKPFYLGMHPVTVGQWRAFVRASGYRTEAEQGDGAYGWTGREWKLDRKFNWHTPGFAQGDDHPVTCVSWNDAVAFCEWLKKVDAGRAYRLSSEAEWEYSCRGGPMSSTKPFHFKQPTASLSSSQANFDGNHPYGGAAKGPYRQATTPVGTFEANALGIFDMHGNVWEWCLDWYNGNYSTTSPPQDPLGPSHGSRRVYRGGGWYSIGQLCRAALRSRNAPSLRSYDLGFRVAVSLVEQV